jgi:hypothetical protein
MKCAVQMASSAMIYEYIPSTIKFGSSIQKLMEKGFTDTKKAW